MILGLRAQVARHGVLVAAVVVMLLALGPFATPTLADFDAGPIAAEQPVDHRNDVPVVQPVQIASSITTGRVPSTGALLVVGLVVGLLLGVTAPRRRPDDSVPRPDHTPSWFRPPRRGPPLLLPG